MRYLWVTILVCFCLNVEVYAKELGSELPARALYNKGITYLDRSNNHPDKALEYFILSSEKGYVEATYMLHLFYQNGIGTTIDKDKSKIYLNLAAKNGHPEALHKLGHIHASGVDAPKNSVYAASLFMQAAEADHNHAMFDYAIRLALGEGIKKDILSAEQWMLKAAQAGNVMAQQKLGYWYRSGYKILSKNEKNSTYWFEKAIKNFKLEAAKGNSKAQFEYAYMLSNGYGTEQNKPEAFSIYQGLAKKNNAQAQFWLGEMYGVGKVVARDMAKAKELILQSATQGYRPAIETKQREGW